MSEKPYLEAVKRQYEDYPYPPRDPDDETRRLIHAMSGNLLAINHHCFGGRKDFRKGFRCLVAGGGTGDTVIYMAEQLRHFDAEVVYLDLSAAARAVAESRARVRKLTNITWVTGSIMELPQLNLGLFDYVESYGVLHHLESTEAGLQALSAVLKDDGAIMLMLYGKYGRQVVYDMQALLRSFLPAGLSMQERVAMTRRLLDSLPQSNGFVRDRAGWDLEISAEGLGDAGLYDLLLHSTDRCFDVPGVYALARSAGLHMLGFSYAQHVYDPLNYVSDPGIRQYLTTLGQEQRETLAEQFVGSLRKHEFYLTKYPRSIASLKDDDLALRSFGTLLDNAPKVAAGMVPGRTIRYADPGYNLAIVSTPIAKVIYAHMDGKTSLKQLRRKIQKAVPGASPAQIEQELKDIYDLLYPRGYLYLIAAGQYGVTVPDYAKLT